MAMQEKIQELAPARNMLYRAMGINSQIAAKIVHSFLYIAFIAVLVTVYNKINSIEEANRLHNIHVLEIQRISNEQIARDQKTNNDSIAVSNILMAQMKAELRIINSPPQQEK